MKNSHKKSNPKDRKDRHHAENDQHWDETHEVRRTQPAPRSGKPKKEEE